MSSRAERIRRKTKNQLRCEICNKLTHVDLEMWNEFHSKSNSIFLCERDNCRLSSCEIVDIEYKNLKVYTKNTFVPELENTYINY
jgi:hypothetical protein